MSDLFTPLPPGPFQIITADPPWTFQTYSEKGKGRSPERHYPCLSLPEIKRLDPASVADPKGSVLLLWATSPMLPAAINTMHAWGYTYKTIVFVWVKVKEPEWSVQDAAYAEQLNGRLADYRLVRPEVGTGYYTRANAEYVLLGSRGKGLQRAARDVSQIIMAPRTRHSAKPVEFFGRVNRLFGVQSRHHLCLELFARGEAYGPNWQVWGNEAKSHHTGYTASFPL